MIDRVIWYLRRTWPWSGWLLVCWAVLLCGLFPRLAALAVAVPFLLYFFDKGHDNG